MPRGGAWADSKATLKPDKPCTPCARSASVKMLDLRKPHEWYPMARALQRRLVYHLGPTNSGKTYEALAAMRRAKSGVYCGPLRLLAMEVYDELNAGGTFCNLITGAADARAPCSHARVPVRPFLGVFCSLYNERRCWRVWHAGTAAW